MSDNQSVDMGWGLLVHEARRGRTTSKGVRAQREAKEREEEKKAKGGGARRGGLGRAREQGWGARTWPCTRLGKQAWVPRACSSRPDIQARIDVHTRCTRGDAHVTDRENVAVNVAL